MLGLRGHWPYVPSPCGRLVLRTGPRLNAAAPTVIADVVFPHIHVFVIHIANIHDIDVGDAAVVEEVTAFPSASHKTLTKIAKAIINTAVEAHLRPPPAGVKKVSTVLPTPPRRSPQITNFGSLNPCSWHPVVVVIVVIPGPISGHPDVTVARTHRLLIHRKRRWPK